MPKTTVDIDHGLLESAKEVLGTSTIKDTVQAALAEVVRRTDRARAIDEIAEMVDSGDVDFDLPEEGITAAEEATSLTVSKRLLVQLIKQTTEGHAPDVGKESPQLQARMRDIRWHTDPGGWQVVGRSGRAMVMRIGDSGLAIGVVDGSTLAASQEEAVHLAEQILRGSGAESSEH